MRERMFARSWKYNALTAAVARGYWRFRTRDVERFVFVATTGRSGTVTLREVFSRVPGCVALHEPYPEMHMDVLHAVAFGDDDYVRFVYRTVKSVNIMRAAAGHRTYVETNHQFVKSFADQAVQDFGDRLSVIHLVRDPVAVANSIFALDDGPGTVHGNGWWLDYHGSANRIRIAELLDDGGPLDHPFHRGLWYWYEMEARVAEFRARHPEVPMVRFATEDLSDGERVTALLRELGVEEAAGSGTRAAERSNVRAHHKVREPLPLDEARRLHDVFQGELRKHGHL